MGIDILTTQEVRKIGRGKGGSRKKRQYRER
jgi:hypothetical protein